MAITIELPHVGESVVEGIIGKWLKQPGDQVEKYDPLVEVVTDKVTMEVPSPADGVLTRILAEEGATVLMGAPIAEMESEETGGATAPPATHEPGQQVETKAPTEVSTIGYLLKDVQPTGPTGGGVEEAVGVPVVAEAEGERAHYSPAVRRLAREHGVDLTQVKGTGLGGRITRNDVLRFVEERQSAPASATPASPTRPTPAPQVAIGPDEEAIPLSPIRRIIAENMVRSTSQIPHAWSMVEADVTALVRRRESLKEEFLRREGAELTYLSFVINAVVESLKEHPMLNSSWGGDKIILKKRIGIGVAVAAPEGLVVPVIHNADSLGIAGLARTLRELTAKAREGKLTLEDVHRGTFTVNNTGALGSIVSQPIINFPQAAILTTEAIKRRPVAVEGDTIAIRSIMNLCLSFDHRIVDGGEAGTFLQSVKGRLEAMGPDTPIY